MTDSFNTDLQTNINSDIMVKVDCQRCKYNWDYQGDKKLDVPYPQYATCPRCRTLVKINDKQQVKKKD